MQFADNLINVLGIIVVPLGFLLVWLVLRRVLGGAFKQPFAEVAGVLTSGFGASWQKLAEAYASGRQLPAGARQRQTVKVGAVMHKRCVTIGADQTGLYLALTGMGRLVSNQPPLSIPWAELSVAGSETLFWQHATVLSVGRPSKGTITLLPDLYAMVKPWLSG
jgi:hypothetical protein